MLDFRELPEDGTDLERLVREIFIREGYETHWTGKGADGGRDLIVVENVSGPLSDFSRTWLVQCKHKAHSGKSVGKDEANSIITDCRRIKATGYLLVCTTQPSSGLINAYQELEESEPLVIKYWDSVTLENILQKPCNFPLLSIFFPISAKTIGWSIYNTNSPSSWAANFERSFFYLSSRLSMQFTSLKYLERIYRMIERVNRKIEQVRLEIRAIYFNDKYTEYKVYLDYLDTDYHNNKQKYDPFIKPEHEDFLEEHLDRFLPVQEGYVPISWDIKYYRVNVHHDGYDPHSRVFYEPYMINFRTGSSRPEVTSID